MSNATPPPPPPPPPPSVPPPPGAGGYQPGYPAGPRNSPLAIVALVTGILGLTCFCIYIFAIVAAITGFIARNQIDGSNGTLKGRGMATAGLVLGIIGIVLGIGWIGLLIAGNANYNFSTSP